MMIPGSGPGIIQFEADYKGMMDKAIKDIICLCLRSPNRIYNFSESQILIMHLFVSV